MESLEIHPSITCGDPIEAIANEHNAMIEIADRSYKRARDHRNIATGLLEALIRLGYDVVTDTDGYIVAAEKANGKTTA